MGNYQRSNWKNKAKKIIYFLEDLLLTELKVITNKILLKALINISPT